MFNLSNLNKKYFDLDQESKVILKKNLFLDDNCIQHSKSTLIKI